MRKLIGMLIDTETCNNMDFPLMYDFALAIIDLHRNILCKFRIILKDVFYGEADLMRSAYYAEKLPQYYEAIAKGEAERFIVETARSTGKPDHICIVIRKNLLPTIGARKMRFVNDNHTRSWIFTKMVYFRKYAFSSYVR